MDLRTATDTRGWKLGRGSVGVDSVFNIALSVCGGIVFVLVLLCITLVSFLVCNNLDKVERELVVFL